MKISFRFMLITLFILYGALVAPLFASGGIIVMEIRKMSPGHCQRGPDRCKACKEASQKSKYCLLTVFHSPVKECMPTIETEVEGRKVWLPYQVSRIFETFKEAKCYAYTHDYVIPRWESSDEGSPLDWRSDSLLASVESRLPAGWSISADGTFLLFTRKEPVLIYVENRINAPPDWGAAQKRAQELGSKGSTRLVFWCEPRWSQEKKLEAKKTNAEVSHRLKNLPAECHVDHLIDAALSRKGELSFVPKTEKDKAAVEAYQKKREALEKEHIKLPDYDSANYSLFLVARIGVNDEFHVVSPPEATKEAQEVENVLWRIKN